LDNQEFITIFNSMGNRSDTWVALFDLFESEYVLSDSKDIVVAALLLEPNKDSDSPLAHLFTDLFYYDEMYIKHSFSELLRCGFMYESLDLRMAGHFVLDKERIASYVHHADLREKFHMFSTRAIQEIKQFAKAVTLISKHTAPSPSPSPKKVSFTMTPGAICMRCLHFRPLRSECHRGAPRRAGFPRVSPTSSCKHFR